MRRLNKTFFLHIVPYVLLLLLPVVGISAFAHHLIFDEIAAYQQEQADFTVKRAMLAVESEIAKAMQAVYQAAQLPAFRAVALEDETAFQEIRAHLLSYTTIVPIISEMVYYNVLAPRYYTSAGTISLSYASEWEAAFWGEPRDTGALLRTVVRPAWYTDSRASRMILVYPLEKRSGAYLSYFLLKLDAQLLESCLTNYHDQSGLAATLYAGTGSVAFKTSNYERSAQGEPQRFEKESTVKESPFWFRFALPENAALQKVGAIQKVYTVIVAMVLLAGSGIIVLAMQKTYTPIRRLSGAARSYFKGPVEGKDDMTLLEGTLSGLAMQNSYLRRIVIQSARESFFRTVLLSTPRLPEEKLEALMREADISSWGQGYFTIALFNASDDFTANQAERLIALAHEYPENVTGIYALSKLAPSHVALILTHCHAHIDVLIQQLYGLLRSMSPSPISLAVSPPSDDYGNASRLYFETRRQLHSMPEGGIRIAAHTEIEYPVAELKTLRAMVAEENLRGLQDTAEELLTISTLMKSEIESLHLCFEMIAILNTNSRFALTPDILKGNDTVPALPQLAALIRRHLAALKERAPAQDDRMRQVLEFIRAHYTDPDFSVSHLADYFNVSVSGISQKFKQATNCGLLKYVTDLKIEKAKELLLSTQLSVHDIAALLGYAQSSSFIRKFKEASGYTPGEYRMRTERE